MFSFAAPRRSRRPSLTPMIDVVFLLLVFFMLAAQFGKDNALRLSGTGSDTVYAGPPRLIELGPEALSLNGREIALEDLAAALDPLMDARADTVVLRGADGADVQRLLDVAQRLEAQGFTGLAVVE